MSLKITKTDIDVLWWATHQIDLLYQEQACGNERLAEQMFGKPMRKLARLQAKLLAAHRGLT